MQEVQFFLASTSPRRIQYLRDLGYRFETLTVAVDESTQNNEKPQAYVERVAKAKTFAGLQSVTLMDKQVVLAADTAVVLDNTIFGKPKNSKEAQSFLRQLSGKTHQVLTCICIADGNESELLTVTSQVSFAHLSDRQIEAYCKTKEPMDKAGAYAIQGYAATFVTHIQGSYSGIVGLPIYETVKLLAKRQIEFYYDC